MNKKILERILIEDDVVFSINSNLDLLLNIIPEINGMIGFEHKHPHHHLDVWNHTLLALSRSSCDIKIRLVLLLHDIGKPFSYQEGEVRHFKRHPDVSSKMAKDILKRLNYNDEEVEEICYLIKVHDNFIKNIDIVNDRKICQERFKIQFCDALVHNPSKLEKRISYLLNINDKVNDGEDKEKYSAILYKIQSEIEENEKKIQK